MNVIFMNHYGLLAFLLHFLYKQSAFCKTNSSGKTLETRQKVFHAALFLKCEYNFANISATKAPIFMKFDTQVCKMIKSHQNNFREDPCTHARKRNANVRCILSHLSI